MAQDKKITVWCGKGFYKSEDDALLEAIKKFEAKTGIKVELSQYADPGHDPEDGGGAGFRHRARCRLFRHLRRAGAGKWAFDGKLEDLSDILVPMKDGVRAEHARDRLPLQRQDQEEGLLRASR